MTAFLALFDKKDEIAEVACQNDHFMLLLQIKKKENHILEISCTIDN